MTSTSTGTIAVSIATTITITSMIGVIIVSVIIRGAVRRQPPLRALAVAQQQPRRAVELSNDI